MAGKEYFDYLINVPLEEELEQIFRVFDFVEDLTEGVSPRYRVTAEKSKAKILVVQQDDMGKTAAQRATSAALQKYDFGIITCVGIAGALNNDLELGDVCYSSMVIDVFDNAKVTDGDNGTERALAPNFYPTPVELTQSLNFLRTNPTLRDAYEEWQLVCSDNATTVYSKKAPNLLTELELIPSSMPGGIVCGDVSASTSYNKTLKGLHRKVLAIETESGGVFEAAAQAGIKLVVTVRGISDKADTEKAALEHANGGAVREVAAYNAALFLRTQIESNGYLAQVLANSSQSSLPYVEENENSHGAVAAALSNINERIYKKLLELSPEYRMKPKGYALPTPRLSQTKAQNPLLKNTAAPIEIFEALEKFDRILVDVPRNYPEASLPWLVAEQLSTTVLNGRQVVPVVVDGGLLAPPANSISVQYPDVDLAAIDAQTDGTLVLIIDEAPLTSRTRSKYMGRELSKYPNAKIVFVSRTELDATILADAVDNVHVEKFALSDISFLNIAHFVEKFYAIEPLEAEVVAIRLKETFDQFALPAHPTYLLGIPKELLTSLLQANRRAELIQLAVTGFLSFVVATDKSAAPLSRTTRERFLRLLVRKLRIEKTSLDEEKTLALVSEFSSEWDFNLNSIGFIQSFLDQGILNFTNGQIGFSLPFIENYLLASELKLSPSDAISYFDFSSDEFDYSAFDIYAELGPDVSIVDTILKLLADRVSKQAPTGGRHILLTNEAAPKMLGREATVARLRDRLTSATSNVQSNKEDKAQKQKVLDLSASMQGAIEKRRAQPRENMNDDLRQIAPLAKLWASSTILLGSGAEHISGSSKRQLVELISEASAAIAQEWAISNTRIDFDDLRDNGFDSEFAVAMEFENEEERQETKKLFKDLVDILEHHVMCQPVLSILGFLTDQARAKVLLNTLVNVQTTGVANVFRAAWMCEIDPEGGRRALIESLKEVGTAPLVRIGLATHFIARVYWHHSGKKVRLALLDLAEEAIKPLPMQFDKGRVQRQIESGQLDADVDLVASPKESKSGK